MRRFVGIFFLLSLLAGCSKVGDTEDPVAGDANVSLTVGYRENPGNVGLAAPINSVNRILILPFQKLNPALANSDSTNFVPVYSLAQQLNAASFPVSNFVLKLPESFTYKVLIIGYNQNDYDFNTPNAPGNRFTIGALASPVRLSNFHLYPKIPFNVPEFFTCFAVAKNGGTTIGTTFTPLKGQTITLEGTLNRLVSGLSLNLSAIPLFVKSVTLSAQRMVKAVRAVDKTATLVQTDGDGESRVIQTLTPVNGSVAFNTLLLPTMAANKTLLYLDIKYGSVVERYTVKVDDSAVSSANSILFFPNRRVQITGTYDKINFGFLLNCNIDLDDDIWDGIVIN